MVGQFLTPRILNKGGSIGPRSGQLSWSNYGPVVVHVLFLKLTDRAFGSHPYRVVSVSYGLAAPFHGGNTGSNPVGDATPFQRLTPVSPETRGTTTVQV